METNGEALGVEVGIERGQEAGINTEDDHEAEAEIEKEDAIDVIPALPDEDDPEVLMPSLRQEWRNHT